MVFRILEVFGRMWIGSLQDLDWFLGIGWFSGLDDFSGLDLVLGLDKDGGFSGLDRFSGFGLFEDQVSSSRIWFNGFMALD